MATTTLAKVFDPEVLTDMVTARITPKLGLANTAAVESVPYEGQGTVLTIPNWQAIGAFTAITEDTAIAETNMDKASDTGALQGYGTHVILTDEAELGAYSDPLSELANQLARRAARIVDSRLAVEAATTDLTTTTGATFTVNDLIGSVTTHWGDEAFAPDGDLAMPGAPPVLGVLVLHSKVFGDVAKLAAFQTSSTLGRAPTVTERNPRNVVGSIAGYDVIVSDVITTTAGTPNTYTNLIVRPRGLVLRRLREVLVESQRAIVEGKARTDFLATVYFNALLRGVGTGLVDQAIKLVTQ